MTRTRSIERVARLGLLAAVAGAAMLDTGCLPRVTFVTPPASECRMDIRLESDPAMRPIRASTGRLVVAPFGFQVTGCGMPSSTNARDTFERLVQRSIDQVCASTDTSAETQATRARFACPASPGPAPRWCKLPGSSTCADHPPISDFFCTRTPSTAPIPDCAVMPPPPEARIEVTPNPVAFAPTLLGTARSATVEVRNAGTGTLTVRMARILVTDMMSIGSFDNSVSSTCSTPLTGGGPPCTLTVRFTPMGTAGTKQARLEIFYNNGTERVEPVPVSGTALAPTLDVPGCTDPPSTPGGLRRLCFGVLGTRRSFTLRSLDGVIPVTLGLAPPPNNHTLVEPMSPSFDVSMAPTTVTVGSTPFMPGTLVINRRDGGAPVSLQLTDSCTVPSGCS